MKIEKLLLELEDLCEKCGYAIRKERGSFRGDQCVVEGENLIVINKNRPPESQAAILASVIKGRDSEEIFIKPAVRKRLEELWDRMDRFNELDEPADNQL